MVAEDIQTEIEGISHLSKQYINYLNKITRPVVLKLRGIGDIIPFMPSIEFNGTDVPQARGKAKGATFTPSTEIIDFYDKKRKTITYAASRIDDRYKDSRGIDKKEDFIQFNDGGYLIIEPDNKLMLARMLFSDKFKDYKYRDKTRQWEYELSSESIKSTEKVSNYLLRLTAMNSVKRMSITEIKKTLMSMYEDDKDKFALISIEEGQDVKLRAFKEAETNPRRFMETSVNEEVSNWLLVTDAIHAGIITFDEDKKEVLCERKKFMSLDLSIKDMDGRVDAIVRYMKSPNNEVRDFVKSLTEILRYTADDICQIGI